MYIYYFYYIIICRWKLIYDVIIFYGLINSILKNLLPKYAVYIWVIYIHKLWRYRFMNDISTLRINIRVYFECLKLTMCDRWIRVYVYLYIYILYIKVCHSFQCQTKCWDYNVVRSKLGEEVEAEIGAL